MSFSKEGIGIGLAAAILAGCSASPPPLFLEHSAPAGIAISPGDAFEAYTKAATQAEDVAAKYTDRTTFTPGKKDEAVRLLDPAIKLVVGSSGKKFSFVFEPTEPFEERPYRRGWRLIGNAVVWKIEDAVRNQDFPLAAKLYLSALEYGFNLCGGSALDSSLGLSIADDARVALAPAVPQMDAATLENLGHGIERIFSGSPSIAQTLENEHAQMLAAVQLIQDAYLKNDFSRFKKELRADILPAIRHLEERKDHRHEVANYFESLAAEAGALTKFYTECGTLNARQRALKKAPQFAESRPWRRWSKFFFRAPESLFTIRDRTVARTRLLALHSLLRAKSKKENSLPASLDAFSKAISIDPYSGQPFVYRVAGTQYRLYSVGQDFKDNGGETEESYTTPDLLLESNDL